MTNIEQTALDNDLKKLSTHFNPKYVSIFVLPTKPKCIFCLKFVVKVPTYVVTKTCSTPQLVNSITFYMDIFPNYPKSKPLVYYGNDVWLHHINVYFSDGHQQCTDVYDPENSSIVELAEKTARAVVFDTGNRRFGSMASSTPEKWQREMERLKKLPTINPALLFSRNLKRTPRSI